MLNIRLAFIEILKKYCKYTPSVNEGEYRIATFYLHLAVIHKEFSNDVLIVM